ncbi:hypothetical protein EV401DRAFT_2124686 [Pisolithus croceorrhizus]|nr:hypothetical protein EV401DRAFT_2124686 [Pisolithus croceorrhizus]
MAAQITSNLPLGERKKEKKFVRKATADILNTTHGHVHTKMAEFLSPKVSYQAQKDINVVDDMVRPQFEARRALWSSKITNAQLNEQVDAFGGGISHMFQEDSDVLLLLNDGSEFLIANLALAKYSIAAMTLCSPKLLSRVPETHPPTAIITDTKFIPLLLEYEGKHHQKTAKQVEITPWVQIETDGTNKTKRCRRVPNNMTFGVAAIRTLFPPSMALSGVDIIVSNHSLSTPYSLAIAYSALHENASFATIDSTRLYDPHNLANVLSARHHPIPYPTVFFIGLDHLEDLSSSILRHAGESWLYSFAWKHKLVAFAEGFLSKDSLWGHMVFDHAWEHVLGDMANALKDVIISGVRCSRQHRLHCQSSMINVHVNPWVSGPVFATQSFDAQVLPSGHEPVHVGGPSINVEAKLKGVKGTYLEDNENPVREIVVHGPTVGASIGEETENVA